MCPALLAQTENLLTGKEVILSTVLAAIIVLMLKGDLVPGYFYKAVKMENERLVEEVSILRLQLSMATRTSEQAANVSPLTKGPTG